jgi:23S rRNA (guanine745-N1)-methyltransferase
MLALRCTVRGCGATIAAAAAAQRRKTSCVRTTVLRGPCGHCFDIARSGYINLLQPQDSCSRAPGDAAEAVAARRRLLDAGAGTALLEALSAVIAGLALPPGARTLDIGSGEGSLLGALAARFGLHAAGVDLSARAADLAARRHPGVLWLVANADRGLPFADGSLDLVLSITARRCPAECARVLAPGGRLVVAVPAPDDLSELREAVLGSASREDRLAKLVEEHAGHFKLVGRRAAREHRAFSATQLEDLLVSTYRGGRAGRRERASGLDSLDVTLSHEIAVFGPLQTSAGDAGGSSAAAAGKRQIDRTGDSC